MWMGMGNKNRERLVEYPEHVVRQHALRRLADVLKSRRRHFLVTIGLVKS